MRRLVPPPVMHIAAQGLARDSDVGAALIIDAEGSTALSARMQPYGPAGAEAFADILSTIFQPMVERVIDNGGVVAELAGDGILAIFTGGLEDAVARASNAAAWVMQDLEHLAEFDTPDGPASLTVRATIGAGEIDWLVWSSEDPENAQNATFAAVGSAVDEARLGEVVTPGGVISVGPTAASVLDRGQVTELDGRFVNIAPAPGEAPPQVDSDPGDSESELNFFPASVSRGDIRAEFRDVVSVFVEFAAPSAKRAATRMNQVLQAVGEFHGYLGGVTKPSAESDGFRVFVIWGAPTSHEHDINYALQFLGDLRDSCGDEMRAGVTLSAVFTGYIGGTQQHVYTAVGPGVNLAARICSSAAWGEFWIDLDSTSDLSEPWGLESIGELDYRGFSQPVETGRITYVPPVRVADPLHGSLVGRGRELDQLEDLLAPLWMGRGVGVAAIAGDPGIGKSLLIRTLEDRLSRREPTPVWLRAQADEIRTQPLATLRDALTDYFGRPGREESGAQLDTYLDGLRSSVPERAQELKRTRSALGDLLDLAPDVANAEQLDPKTRFENLVIAVENLVEALERTAPVIISIADGHWLDSGTAEVLRQIATDLRDKRLAVLIETREPEIGIEYDRMIHIGPLREADMTAIAEQMLGEPPPAKLVEDLYARSGGNPFFAQQLLEYRNTGASIAPSSTDEADVPADIRRLLVARLDGLPSGVRRMVQTASVLGREVDLDVLGTMTSEDPLSAEHIQGAVDSGVWSLSDEAHVNFSSLLIRDAAYGMLTHAETGPLHGKAAAAIEANLGPDQRRDAELAYHYERAGDPKLAAGFHIGAGQVSSDRYDNKQAHIHFDRALELLSDVDGDGRYRTLRHKHDVFELEGDRESQGQMISAMEQLGIDDHFVDIVLLRTRLLISLGRYQEAEDVVVGVEVSNRDLTEQGQILFVKAQLARYLGRNDEAAALARSARGSLISAGDDLRVALIDDFRGGIAWENGEFERAAELHNSASDRFAEAGSVIHETRALNNLGTALFSIGDYAEARKIHQEGAERSREIGYRMGEGDHLDNMGGTAWAVGDLELALHYYEEALRIRKGMNDAWGVAISKGNLGSTKRAMGHPEEALDLYREALEIDQRIGRRRGEAYDLHGIGLCHTDLGHLNLATESLKQAAQIREDLGEVHLANESHVACAVAMLRSGDAEGAVDLVDAVLESEGDAFFDGAVETTATRLRSVEVIEVMSPRRAAVLRERTVEGVSDRANRISDPDQRRSYLEQVESHSQAVRGQSP